MSELPKVFTATQLGWMRRGDLERKGGGHVWEQPNGTLRIVRGQYEPVMVVHKTRRRVDKSA